MQTSTPWPGPRSLPLQGPGLTLLCGTSVPAPAVRAPMLPLFACDSALCMNVLARPQGSPAWVVTSLCFVFSSFSSQQPSVGPTLPLVSLFVPLCLAFTLAPPAPSPVFSVFLPTPWLPPSAPHPTPPHVCPAPPLLSLYSRPSLAWRRLSIDVCRETHALRGQGHSQGGERPGRMDAQQSKGAAWSACVLRRCVSSTGQWALRRVQSATWRCVFCSQATGAAPHTACACVMRPCASQVISRFCVSRRVASQTWSLWLVHTGSARCSVVRTRDGTKNSCNGAQSVI